MQIQTDVIGFNKSLSKASPISKSTGPAFSKPCPKVTIFSSLTSSAVITHDVTYRYRVRVPIYLVVRSIELRSSCGTFSSIAKID